MAKKSLIQREKKRQKLEQKYHSIRRSSKKETSKVTKVTTYLQYLKYLSIRHIEGVDTVT
ncbi:hypothetical protein RND71_012419 [Anisodus tanguticus]|uniref:Ribosomal protein S14 n=1 Tax=Anisodus tanguticus TaxID=243964 RepID=A0AAE1SFQ5_9SOLA|nr:hypothetical protein RND71_012419 [Anisodus tanguticus]